MDETLYQIALHSGNAREGANLTVSLNMKVSPDTLLRQIKKYPLPTQPTPRVLGVDDWAWKKSESYGSILVDLEKHRPIELLPDRTEKTFATWLANHSGVEIISRDRAGSYAMAARNSAPTAIQIADRFHVHKNLRESVEQVVRRNYAQIQQVLLANTTASTTNTIAQTLATQKLRPKWHAAQKEARFERRKALYEQVQSLQQKGYNITAIAEELEISRRRVRVLLQGSPEMKRVIRPTKIDPYKTYLRQRFFEDGCHNAKQLWREVKAQGYEGSESWLLSYISQLRQQLVDRNPEVTVLQAMTQPKPLSDFLYSPRQLTRWFIKDKRELRASQQTKLAELCQKIGELAVTYELTQAFIAMYKVREAYNLGEWLNRSEHCGVRELESFGHGIRRDEAAVRAGINLRWSNGPVEGEVNKLKVIKRQMFGRAKFELLRARVLAA